MIDSTDLSKVGRAPVLEGDALVLALTRRFRTSIQDATVGDHTFSILKPANPDDLIREEDFVRDERLPYWADVWPSSIILAEKLGFDVLATDYYEDALDVTRANVFRNLGTIARTRLVDWRHLPEDLGTFDLVFASDVLYEKEYAELLPVILERLLTPPGFGLIADPGRVAAPQFVEACGEHGLAVREKQTRSFEAGEIKQKIDIYEIGRA